MNVKKYVLFQLRSWFPMIIAMSAIVISITVIIGLNASPYISVSMNSGADYQTSHELFALYHSAFSCLIGMMIPSLLACCVLPFFAYSHRYGKIRADCFLSLPVRSGKVTQVRMLLAGAILLSIYFVSYLLGILACIAKQSALIASALRTIEANAAYISDYTVSSPAYGWYFLGWALGGLVVASMFLINAFLIGQGSNLLQGVIAMIAGHTAIILLVPSFLLLPSFAIENTSWLNSLGYGSPFLFMPSFYAPLVFIEMTLGTLEKNLASCHESCMEYVSHWNLWFSSSLFLLLGGGALATLLLGKEPGGEFAGENRPRSMFAFLLPHFAFTAVLLFSAVSRYALGSIFYGSSYFSTFLPLFLTTFVWGAGLYYVCLSLYNRSFKLDRLNWIIFASVNGFALCCLFLSSIDLSLNLNL